MGKDRELSLEPTSPLGSVITRLEILDLDSEDNARCFFWLSSSSKLFKIGENSGILSVAGRLDYEQQKKHHLTVFAKNLASGTGIISRNLTILLEDENDESPRFLKGSPQTLEVYENLLGPYPLIISNSVSEDEDQGDTVAYSLLSGNSSLFSVDTKSGDILLLNSLDREDQNRHELTILAADSGRPRRTTHAQITINVLDENDHSPQFLQPYYRAKLLENSDNGTEVIQIIAEDEDEAENAEITYRILEKNAPFFINPQTGRITVMGKVDREEQDEWQLTIEAKDGGRFKSLSSIVMVWVTVIGVNDNPPVIRNTQMDVFINGRMKKGETIHVVDIFDPDGDLPTLSLSGHDSSNFEVLQDGQIVCLLDSLLMKSFYTVTVTVEDPDGKSASATFTFYVDDTIFPAFSPMGTVQIPENSLQNVANFKATTTKPYPANQLQYSILAGNDGSFTVGSLNGVLSLLKPLDREKKNFYRIWIRATDSDTPSKSSIQSVDIHVLDQNDKKPKFSQVVYNATIKENTEPQDLLTISAYDEDQRANAQISYKITHGNDDSFFAIDEHGVLRSLAPLDRESTVIHRLTVTATDSGSPPLSQDALVVITVEDEDDNSPKFTRLFHAEIAEDLPVGSEVVLVSATDIDGSNSHNFSLEESDGTFSINRTSGWITLVMPLDREVISSYRLRVRLEDGVWTIFTSVQITIMDTNDNSPAFERLSYLATPETPGKIRAIDVDEGKNGLIYYSLLEDNPYISIEAQSGVIHVLGRSPRNIEKVTVIARDSGIPCRSASTALWIFFNYTHLAPLTLGFSKRTAIGDLIWKLSSGDDYFLSSPYFRLTNGTIFLTASTESLPLGPSSDLGTLAEIGSGLITLQSLAIKFLEEDPPAPKFLSKTTRLVVPEETAVGSYLGQLEFNADGWRRITVEGETDLVQITKRGGIILMEDLDKKIYNLTIIVEGLWEEKDTTQLILEVKRSPENGRKNILEKKINPFVYLGASWPICLPAWMMEVFDTVEEASLDDVNCLLINGTIPQQVTLLSSLEEAKTLSIPLFNTLELKRTVPGIQTIAVQSPTVKGIGIRIQKLAERDGNCSAVEESKLQGYCIINNFLETCGRRRHSKTSNLMIVKMLCSGSVQFLDFVIPPSGISSLRPETLTLRENQPPQKIGKLLLGGERLVIADPETRKLFTISGTNELHSLRSFDREEKSFYSIPLTSSSGQNYTIRVLIDDILDSSPLQNQNLTVVLFGHLKTIVKGLIHPAGLDTVHQFSCGMVDDPGVKITADCFLSMRQFPEKKRTLTAEKNNISLPYDVHFSLKPLRLFKLDSALFLSFFGPSDAVATFFSGLFTAFPDLKFYPVAISTRDNYFHSLVMGIADRHDTMVSLKEGRSVVDSFLASNPVLDLLEPEKSSCMNYSLRIRTSGSHLAFRGTNSLWLLPEGRVEMGCEQKEDHQNLLEEKKNQKRPEICSKQTCPEGICSIEDGKVVCLNGEEEDVCGDLAAVSLTSGHLELLPTAFYQAFLLQKGSECNDSVISFDFKTKSDGNLISLKNKHGFRSSLEVVKGVPTYRLSDAYRSPVEIPVTRVVADGEWHTLSFKMMDNGRRIQLEIDGIGREARTKTHLPLPLAENLKSVQIGGEGGNQRFIGCLRRLSLNDHHLPLHGSSHNQEELFSVSAVGHISWSNGHSTSWHLSTSSLVVIAAILALAAVICLVYFISRFYFRWKDKKQPAWQETRDIDAITVRHPPKNSPLSSSTETHIYDVADRIRKPQETELSSFERAPTLPVRKIRTVGDVALQIPRTSTPKSFYRNDGYV